jgi:hypothetical protein
MNFYMNTDNELVIESWNETTQGFEVAGFIEEEMVCALLDMLLTDFQCSIVDREGYRHCHKCGNDVGPLSSHGCATGALTAAKARRT